MNILYPPFLENITKTHLIQKNDTIISAFSGGKDSVTQLLLLKKLAGDIDFTLAAAYFNHRLRVDAEEEEQWVKNFCSAQGIELFSGSGDVRKYAEERRLNLENAASILRSRFLEETAARLGRARIATAHTRSDLVETFFIKLFRGSGSRGLSAIYQKVGKHGEVVLIRPLLIFSQKDILAFLERNKIEYYKDYTNEQDIFLRNRIRSVLLPEVEKIEPRIEERIYRTVLLIQEEHDFFCQEAGRLLDEHVIQGKVLPIAALAGKHIALQRYILREYIRRLKGDLLAIDFVHIETILAGLSTMKGCAVPGLELKIHKGYMYPADFSLPSYCLLAESPGVLDIPGTGKKMIIKKTTVYKKLMAKNEILVSYAALTLPLTIRAAQRTDQYRKLNAAFKQDVFEMIREAGFPAALRNLCPVVVSGDGQIIWAAGCPPAETFKMDEKVEPPYLNIIYQ